MDHTPIAFVTYLRVSTLKQGTSGLGLEAQRAAVAAFVKSTSAPIRAAFLEVETGTKRKRHKRPQLKAAMHECLLTGATLLIAKLDRLARDVGFLAQLRDSGIKFVCADMPSASRVMLDIMMAVAEEESRLISQRTKAALAAAKARGVKLGGPNGFSTDRTHDNADTIAVRVEKADKFAKRVGPTIAALRASGISLRQIAATLTECGILTAAGGDWTAMAVRNALLRFEAIEKPASMQRVAMRRTPPELHAERLAELIIG